MGVGLNTKVVEKDKNTRLVVILERSIRGMPQIVGESRNEHTGKSLANSSYLCCNNVFIMFTISLPNERNKLIVILDNYPDVVLNSWDSF